MSKFLMKPRQEGAALLVCLIVLVLATLLGLTTMKTSTIQEKISGGNSDKALAMQAAELALRGAEEYVRADVNPEDAFADQCLKGLCYPPLDGKMLSETIDWEGANVLTFGKGSLATLVAGVTKQPRFLIEIMPPMLALTGNAAGVRAKATAYRITVLAFGRQENTRIVLQSTYYKP